MPPRAQQSQRWLFGGASDPAALPSRHPPRLRCCGVWYEAHCRRAGFQLIAGVDEVGRGALFGPVLAAAVILDLPEDLARKSPRVIRGLKDSKQLPVKERERLSREIRERALAWSVAVIDAGEIDRINIYQASRAAMRQAVLGLSRIPGVVLVDALRLDLIHPQVPIIRGDEISVSIAAASIIAKVERDRLMREWHAVYPQYQLCDNKGYATSLHRARLRQFGPTPLHRRSFAPVAEVSRDESRAPGTLFPANGSEAV